MKIKEVDNYTSLLENKNKYLINEAWLIEDPVYQQFKQLGQYLTERKLSEPEILKLFGAIETGMTNKDTGANRTWLGRGKDTTMNAAAAVKNAFSSVMGSIQNSVPVQSVDVAYDKATDALAKVTGGQNSKIMKAIKGYRNLVKEYPKAAGFAKAALVAITGLATGGAGLPIIAGLTYALDSAIRGDKLSSVIGKGAGAAAVTWAGKSAAEYIKGQTGSGIDVGVDSSNAEPSGSNPTASDVSASGDTGGAEQTSAGTDGMGTWDDMEHSFAYKVKQGDTLSDILHDRQINPEIARRLNPDLFNADGNPNILKTGQTIRLPNPEDIDKWEGLVYTGTPGGGYHGQYAPNNWSSLDATNNLKQQELGRWGSDSGMAAARAAKDAAKSLKESINWKILSADQLFDKKLTIMNWKLNESNGRPRGSSVHLTTSGIDAIFENVNRYAKAIVEQEQLINEARPAEYRPDMTAGSGGYKKSQKGFMGKGLDWLDRTSGKIGSALSNFGHQFTTKVTKEKLKMNWHQAGKPSDSEVIAQFLVKQGVPQSVITDIYSKMGISATAPQTQTSVPRTSTAQPTAAATQPSNTTQGSDADELSRIRKNAGLSTGGAGAFSQMAQQLTQPTKSSTGGTITQTDTGLIHRANPNNPNFNKPASTMPNVKANAAQTMRRKPTVKPQPVGKPQPTLH